VKEKQEESSKKIFRAIHESILLPVFTFNTNESFYFNALFFYRVEGK